MPLKDVVKKKEYDKYWLESNRDKWNKYQAKYAVQRRRKVVEDAKQMVIALNITNDTGSIGFKAAVIFILLLQQKYKFARRIANRTGYDLKEVKSIIENWQKNKLYIDGVFYIDGWETDMEFTITLSLISLVGTGEIVAIQV